MVCPMCVAAALSSAAPAVGAAIAGLAAARAVAGAGDDRSRRRACVREAARAAAEDKPASRPQVPLAGRDRAPGA